MRLSLRSWTWAWAWAALALACDRPEPRPLDLGHAPPGEDGGIGEVGPADLGPSDGDGGGSDNGDVNLGPADSGEGLDVDPCAAPAPVGPSRVGAPPEEANVEVTSAEGCRRAYRLTTTAALRDPSRSTTRTFTEPVDRPYLRSGSPLLDALYALAVVEAQEASVDRIQDGAFQQGAPVQCAPPGCFETGRLWRWVWTRDTAFAGDLGLASLDPLRLASALEFKLSERRGGGDLQIIQDTGTGGSYPISTDRVVWALGAQAVLAELEGSARDAFRDRVLLALRNTLEHDRVVIFDPEAGLYRGETSFLDWREQSYPPWTAADPGAIGASLSLSTNLLHLLAIELLAALLVEVGDPAAATWSARAQALRSAIGRHFERPGQAPAAFVPSTLDPGSVERQDALATAFYVLAGLAPDPAAALADQPFLPGGPPVLWPAQPNTAIYHNRAVWPFVTAYLARAGRRARHDQVVTLAAQSLIRGAALQLSHVENLEMTTGRAFVDDGNLSGPVVHSERQLWSIGGFLSLIEQTLVGREVTPEGLRFVPYLPRAWRAELGDRVQLRGLVHRGRRYEVELLLPPTTADRAGAYGVGRVLLNGTEAPGGLIPAESLEGARIQVELLDQAEAGRTARVITGLDAASTQGPAPPGIGGISAVASGLRVPLSGGAPGSSYEVLRDGVVVATGLPGSAAEWIDVSASASAPSHCYTIQLRAQGSGLVSQRSPASCWWGPGYDRIQNFSADTFTAVGGQLVNNYGRWHYQAWGDPGHQLTSPDFVPRGGGRHFLQLVAGNGAGPISTGVTCAVKRVRVLEVVSGAEVNVAYLALPQLGAWSEWRDSSLVPVELVAGRAYRVVIDDDPRAINMSSFEHYARYSAGIGGAAPFNRVNIAELKILRRDP